MTPNNENTNTQSTQELIDSYLLGTLDVAALSAFKVRMANSPEFTAEVEKQKTLMRGVEKSALKNSLNQFHEEIEDLPEKSWLLRGWLALAASLLILLGVCTWAILNTENSAEKVFAATFKPDPGLPTTMGTSSDYEFYYGMVRYKRKEYKEAILRWEPIYAANPENDTVVYFLGVANLANGNPRSAKKYLQSIEKRTESAFYEDILYYLALTFLKENRIDEAIATLEKIDTEQSSKLLAKLNSL